MSAPLPRIRKVEPSPDQTPEEEWIESVHAVCFEMAQRPTWRRRSELLKDAEMKMHRYFSKRAGNR